NELELCSEINFIHHEKELEEIIPISISQAEMLSHLLWESINQKNESQRIYPEITALVFEQINTINLEDNRVNLLGSIEVDSETLIVVDIGVIYKSDIISTRLILIYNDICHIYHLSNQNTEKLINGLSNAISFLNNNCPKIIQDKTIGTLGSLSSNQEEQRICVQVDGGIYEKYLGICILLETSEDHSSYWWFNDIEIKKISRQLKKASEALATQEVKVVGYLNSDTSEPCLRISTEWNYLYPDGRIQVQVKFDDELVRESSHDGIFWLSGNEAEFFSHLLDEALKFKKIHPPYIYQSSEPSDTIIFQLY
ncbi:MAG TPA: hypothetical protein V6D19_22260, partial [Stenomitos sp.]